MPIGGMQNRLRRIPRLRRRLGHGRGNFQAADNVPVEPEPVLEGCKLLNGHLHSKYRRPAVI